MSKSKNSESEKYSNLDYDQNNKSPDNNGSEAEGWVGDPKKYPVKADDKIISNKTMDLSNDKDKDPLSGETKPDNPHVNKR
jgi:hypothetical protein